MSDMRYDGYDEWRERSNDEREETQLLQELEEQEAWQNYVDTWTAEQHEAFLNRCNGYAELIENYLDKEEQE